MSQDDNTLPQKKHPEQKVVFVQAATDFHAHSHINIHDFLATYLRNLKSYFVLVLVFFILLFGAFYWRGQHVTYKRMIAMPTYQDSADINKGAVPVLSASNVAANFKAHYLLPWVVNQNYYVNKTFTYNDTFPGGDQGDQGQAIPAGMLMLYIKSSLKHKQQIESLFDASLKAIQAIASQQMQIWQSGMRQKIALQSGLIQSLQKNLRSAQQASMYHGNAELAETHSLMITEIQDKLIAANQQLTADKALVSSVKGNVQWAGPLLIGQPDGLLVILVKSLIASLLVATMIMSFIIAIAISARHHNS